MDRSTDTNLGLFPKDFSIDCDETCTLVAKMDSIRLELSIATAKGWEVHHMDMKNVMAGIN
jgi:hypothetical protein